VEEFKRENPAVAARAVARVRSSPLVSGWITMAGAAVAIQLVENDMPKKMSQAFTMSAEAADCPRFPTSLCRYWRAGGEA
jgi:hypothetical protein